MVQEENNKKGRVGEYQAEIKRKERFIHVAEEDFNK